MSNKLPAINKKALRYINTDDRTREIPVLRQYDTVASKKPRIRQVFLDVSFIKRATGLIQVCRDAKVPIESMGAGDFVAFINSERNKVAVLTIERGITVLVECSAPRRTTITFDFFTQLPRIFGARNDLGLKSALTTCMKQFLVAKPKRRLKTVKPLNAETGAVSAETGAVSAETGAAP